MQWIPAVLLCYFRLLMKVAWLTDIHLNFLEVEARARFLRRVAKKEPDAVLISGDIGEADCLFHYLGHIHSEVAAPVYFVLGNHDYYRGSIRSLRAALPSLLKRCQRLHWLTQEKVISLTSTTALIGDDGWADGRLGNYEKSPVMLNDFMLIAELSLSSKAARLRVMQELAQEAAEHLKNALTLALEQHRKVIILTHVPPFQGAAWYRGKPSDSDYLPFFSCQAMGDVLQSIMASHSRNEALVLCGHTHGKGQYRPLPNLTVITGEACYGHPTVQQLLEVD